MNMDESIKSRLIEILTKLVSFPTITGNALAAHDCLNYSEVVLQNSGMHITKHHSGGFGSLVATSHPHKRPKILLQAHIDVVPAPEHMFVLRKEDGRLYGRGVFDMKYTVACYLLAAEQLKLQMKDYCFGIMLTTDEESNGQNGVKYLLDKGYGCDVCLLPDGGDNWRIETAAKGGLAVKITAKGVSAHGSRPWEGDNAIEHLLKFIKQAKKLVPVSGPEGTTMVLSQIEGGQTHNQVPGTSSATFDIRFADSVAGEKIHKRLAKLAAEHDVIIQTVSMLQPVHLDAAIPQVKAWEQVVTQIRGKNQETYSFSYGASDARYFASKGIPAIVTRPDGGGHHGPGEWLEETGLYDFYACVQRYIETVAETPVATEADMGYTTTQLPETVAEAPEIP
jgi:succinyl-diaminopimelate desuccinylase